MISNLLESINSYGDRGAVVPFSRIDDLKRDMVDLKNGDCHPSWLDRMANHIISISNKFIPADLSFEPRSLITIIMPSPKVVLEFIYNGKTVPCVIPPHYSNGKQRCERALQYLKDYLSLHDYSVAMAITLPQKLLAVHCGLAQYGRNNICYNNEFGSYMQIMTYISDLPCEESLWFPVRRMEICDKCHSCVTSCPTGAIDKNRQLINSDKCITLFNEFPGEFPEWIDKEAHNSIVGCTRCQDYCPGNLRNKNNIESSISFSEEETAELINNKGDTSYSDSLTAKIKATGISSEYTNSKIFPRNMRAILER